MNIVLGICGSVAAYKAHELSRLFIKAGHDVRIVLTKGACQFVSTNSFAWPGVKDCYLPDDDFNKSTSQQILHIELARWADKFVIVPLSANTLSDLASARAGDLLTSVFLAFGSQKPVVVFPAMNTQMLKHPLVENNLNTLKMLPNVFIHPGDSGELACGEIGEGKLAQPENINDFIAAIGMPVNLQAKKYLITTGATIAPLDPVRYLTNGSSGLTGLFLATEALAQGHQVTVIAGQHASSRLNHLIPHPRFNLIRVLTTSDMQIQVNNHFSTSDVYVSAAAIGDFEFDLKLDHEQKIKKDSIGDNLAIKKSSDILAEVIASKKATQTIVGFAAETDLTPQMLRQKMDRKPVDLLIGTKVHSGLTAMNQKPVGFTTTNADYLVMKKNGELQEMHLSKQQLSKLILSFDMTEKYS